MADWQAALDSLMLPQIDLTARLIKDPELDPALPAAARLCLTGYLKALGRERAPGGVTVNSMLPGVFGMRTQKEHIATLARGSGRSEVEVTRERARLTPAGRIGGRRLRGLDLKLGRLTAGGSGLRPASRHHTKGPDGPEKACLPGCFFRPCPRSGPAQAPVSARDTP